MWSRVWTDGDEGIPTDMGEDRTYVHTYDFGDPHAEIPPAVLIGEPACIRDGERLPLPIVVRTFEGGWDSRCYQFRPPFAAPYPWPISINDCHWQHRVAQAIDLIYTSGSAAAVAYLAPFLPGATFVAYDNGPSVLPGCVIILYPDFVAILMAGTTTPQQWALQALSGAIGIHDFGLYSTLFFWWTSALQMSERMYLAGPVDVPQVLFAGHSYGGALASIMATRARLASPSRGIQLLTYGSPKPGDSRMIGILRSVRQVHFVNNDDPVTFMPPSSSDLGTYAAFIPNAVARRWMAYTRPEGLIGLSIQGVRTDSPLPESMYTLMLRIARQAVAGTNIEVINAHLTSEYARRIWCPAEPVPSPEPWVLPALWLQNATLQTNPDASLMSDWGDSSVYGHPALQLVGDSGLFSESFYTLGQEAQSAPNLRLSLTNPVAPSGEWSLHIVAGWEGFLGVSSNVVPMWDAATNHYWPSIRTTGIGILWGVGNNHTAVPDTRGTPHLFSWRLVGNQVERWVDGIFVGQSVQPSGRTLGMGFVGCRPTGTWTLPRLMLIEVVYLEGSVPTVDFTDWADYLKELFGIP